VRVLFFRSAFKYFLNQGSTLSAENSQTLLATFFVLTSIAKTSLEAATYLAFIALLASSVMLIVRYAVARKCLVFYFPWISVSKYVLASAVMVMVLLVIPHPARLSMAVAFTLLGAVIYLTVLILIDKEAKSLVKSILQEFMRIMKISKPQINVS